MLFRDADKPAATTPTATKTTAPAAAKPVTPPKPAAATTTAPATTTATVPTTTIAVTRAQSIDPTDSKYLSERPQEVPKSMDGDPQTAWSSYPNKGQVGLVYDLGSPQQVTAVDLTFPQGTYPVEVHVADLPNGKRIRQLGLDDLVAMPKLGENPGASGTATIQGTPLTGRYVVVWFPSQPTSNDGNRAALSEIVVH